MADRVVFAADSPGTQDPEDGVEGRFEVGDVSPLAILRVLRSPGTGRDDRRMAILDAEVLDFDPVEALDLTPVLREYIAEYRDSDGPEDRVAVGSAIRKFVAVAPTAEAIAYAARLLEAGSGPPLPIGLEVEISKMVVRKLVANPPAEPDRYPDLATRLRELAETYLDPRLLGGEKRGAVALNAVLGLILTGDSRVAGTLDRVRGLEVGWFRQLLARQATALISELGREGAGPAHPQVVRSLESLVDAARAAPLA